MGGKSLQHKFLNVDSSNIYIRDVTVALAPMPRAPRLDGIEFATQPRVREIAVMMAKWHSHR